MSVFGIYTRKNRRWMSVSIAKTCLRGGKSCLNSNQAGISVSEQALFPEPKKQTISRTAEEPNGNENNSTVKDHRTSHGVHVSCLLEQYLQFIYMGTLWRRKCGIILPYLAQIMLCNSGGCMQIKLGDACNTKMQTIFAIYST